MIDEDLLLITFDVYHPFGASTPLSVDNPGRLVPDLPCGRGSGLAGLLAWTHYLDCQPDVDIVDGCSRPPGSDAPLYADGDGVIVHGNIEVKFVVVFWTWVNQGDETDFYRVYLMRDSIV